MELHCRDLGVRYRRQEALQHVTWSIGPGLHALLGPNGAGKSTLQSVLATLRNPTSGSWGLGEFDGCDHDAIRPLIGYLPQDVRFHARFTVRETLEYAAWLRRIPPNEVAPAVDTALDATRLGDRSHQRAKELSGGMRRRLGIAHAIVGTPSLIVLDEPTAGLDIAQRRSLVATMRSLAENGSCVLFSTHIPDDVESSCDSVLILDAGKSVFQGTITEMVEGHPSFDDAYLARVTA